MFNRRSLGALVASLAISLIASPALAGSDSFHFRGSGSSAYGFFTNVPMDQEQIPPGSYFYTDIWASHSIVTGEGNTYEDSAACLFHQTFTIDAGGNWTSDAWFGTCVSGADLSISKRLIGASLVATLPLEECLAWDEATGECTEIVNLGTAVVDLTWTGVGPTYRYHGTGSGGAAGNYQYTYHGNGASRNASPSGSATLVSPDGSEEDLTGGLDGLGSISQSRDGYVQVIISHG
jgi:hypothetical protein